MRPEKWTSASVFHLTDLIDIDKLESIQKWSEPLEGHDSIGLVPLYGEEHIAPMANSGAWFRIRTSQRKVSASDLKMQVAKRIKQIEDASGRRVGGKERLEIRDHVTLDLKKNTPPTHTDTDIMFRGDWFIVCTSSSATCDYLTSFLRAKLSSLPIVTAATTESLSNLGKSLFRQDQLAIDNVILGDSIDVDLIDGTNLKASNSQYGQHLINTLKTAAEVKSMAIEWGALSAKIKENLTLSSIDDGFDTGGVEFDDGDESEMDPAEQAFLESRARAELFVANIPLLLTDIAIHCGGFRKVEEAA